MEVVVGDLQKAMSELWASVRRVIRAMWDATRKAFMKLNFDLTPMQHQMITEVHLPMARRVRHGKTRHKKIKRLHDVRRRLEKQMIRSGNMSAALRGPVRGT